MEVDFYILDKDLLELQKMSKEEFEEFNDIEAQFYIKFENIEIGYVDKESVIATELLVTWLMRLNLAKKSITEKSYVAFAVPDLLTWIEINKKNDILIINEAELKTIDLFIQTSKKLIDNKEESYIFKTATKFDYVAQKDFFRCIEDSTYQLVEKLYKVNPELLNTKSLLKLCDIAGLRKN